MFTGKFRKQRQSSENRDNYKAPNLLRHLPFCSKLYSSLITYLLWSSILFATFNCLHDLCQRPWHQGNTWSVSIHPNFKNQAETNQHLYTDWKETMQTHHSWKSVLRCLYDSLPCPPLKKEGSKQNAGSPMKSLKRQYGFSYERMEKWEPWGTFSGTLSFINQECISHIPTFPNGTLNQRNAREQQNPSGLVACLTVSSSTPREMVFQAIP